MGVLMSKKQQVDKVQKCSAVVSAFKEGLKDRPPPARAQNISQPEEECTAVTPSTGKGHEEGQLQEQCKKASVSQVASASLKEDDCKVNQEAWSRLRDGKGVEPEDLNKTAHQLSPPAFVRPKRDANDDRPVDIVLGQREQPINDEMCEICEVWTADDLFPCRVCCRVFHDGCLREMGYLRTDSLQQMRETAHTSAGWSCCYCDNVNLLLTEEEMYSLTETFKQCKIIPESCLVSDEFLQYKHFVSKQLSDRDLADDQEEEVLAHFSALDPEQKGQIEWTDFLYHESLGVLNKFRSKNSLIRLLTAKERDRARSVFLSLDQDSDGLVLSGEVQKAQQAWFQKHTKEPQSCNVSISHVGPMSENSPASSGSEKSREKTSISSGKDDKRQMNWQDFMKESAIYILAARPNSTAVHLHPPL